MQVLDTTVVIDVLRRWHAGMAKSQIARDVCVDRKTVRKYVRAAEAAGVRPGGPPLAPDEWARHVATLFPEIADVRRRQPTRTELDRHRDLIATLHGTMSVSGIHRTLRDERGLVVSLASLRRYLRGGLALPE